MEFKQIIGNTWCLAGHQLLPLYRLDSHRCILLDTGIQSRREEIQAALDAHGLTPIGLLCTHTHFDHFGNARYFSERYRCPVALPLGEAEICRTLAAVKSHLFVYSAGQVAADPEMSQLPCVVDQAIRPDETDTLFCGVRFRVLHTPGHSIDHVSYLTPDGVCYAGDALMCGRTLHGSRLPYAFNFQQSLDTIRGLKGLDCQAVAVAHCGVVYEDFDGLVEENFRAMEEQLAQVRALVDRPMSSDEICDAVCRRMGVVVNTVKKAQDLERFLRPYMEYLVDSGSHRMTLRGNSLCYEPVR